MDDAFERAVDEERRDRRNRRHRRARAGFRVHLTTFLAVNALLLLIWVGTTMGGGGHPWFLYPLVGWGIGLAVHYSVVRPALSRERTRPAAREADR